MIQSLYRDKRAVWLRACHDTIDCIVTGGSGLAAGCVAIQTRHSQRKHYDTTLGARRGARVRAAIRPPKPATLPG